jgi:pimeloyl-ACP methyl ester carboxylesterase
VGGAGEADQLTPDAGNHGARLGLHRWGGAGETVVLVHGDVTAGEAAWSRQRPLAERWRLVVVDRRGFGDARALGGSEREDFEVDAADVAGLVAAIAPVHLVGHSYGGVVALLAADRRPDAVRSLTVIEPPAYAVARGHPGVEDLLARQVRLVEEGQGLPPEEYLRRFLADVGSDPDRVPSPLPEELERHTRIVMGFRPPWEARIPLDRLAASGIRTLVVSGGHDDGFEAICDAIAGRLGAERSTIAGAGHNVPRVADTLNPRLERFWRAAGTR